MLIVSSQTCSSYSSSVSSSSSLSSSSSSSSCLPFVSLSSELIFLGFPALHYHPDIVSAGSLSSRQWQVPNRVALRLFLSKRNLRIFYDLDRHVRSSISLCSSASSTFPPNSNHNYQPRFLVNDCVSR